MTFYSTLDNTGYIKLNYISDDNLAARINELATVANAPSVASPALMGGYTFPILAKFANGAMYQILKAPLPKGNHSHEALIEAWAAQPETLYSYVDEGDVTIVQIEGWDRSKTPMSSLGWLINAGPKTFKRLKTVNRPFRLWAELNRPLNVYVVEDDGYSDEDLSDFEPDEIERLLDGGFVISSELYDACLANVAFPVVPTDERPELMVDYYRSEEYLRQAQNFHAFNARIFGPMHFSGLHQGDELHDRPALLKGEGFKHVSDTCAKLHVDVICARSALKFEVASTVDTWVLLEPQKAKRSGVNSDLQTMINLQALYQPEDVENWIREYLLANFEALKQDKIMESWFDMATPFFNSSSRWFDQNDVTTLTKWNARAWLMSGRRITESPWLFEQLGSAIAKSIRSTDQSKLRFPVPCAVRAQVISQSFASMAGCDVSVIEGSARWCEDLESIVVNDLDWIEMYRSHGGHDLDDFFVGYYRTIGNCRKIVLVRSPNDWGEYSIFDYVEGDWYPTFERHDGSFIIFPEVTANPDLWPKRLSECVRDNEIIYTGLPSQKDKQAIEPHPYGIGDVMHLVRNNQASAACVGANVNSRGLWALSTRKHRSIQLTSMENCIDTGTQGGSAEDADAVMAEAKDIIDIIVKDPTIEVDEYMWVTRFAQIFGRPFDYSRFTNRTHISQAHRFRLDAAQSFMRMVRDYAQKQLKEAVDPQVHVLGKRLLKHAYDVLLATRLSMVNMQPVGEQNLAPGDWRNIHSFALEAINSYEDEQDRHDFVLALYSVCFKVPARSSGKVSDQLVMNPHIFPFLLNAMRFYGLARHVEVDPHGRLVTRINSEWELKCESCGREDVVDNPLIVQAYHANKGICKPCRAEQA